MNISIKKTELYSFRNIKKNYYNFFLIPTAKKNYKFVKNDCLCGEKNDVLLSQTDRHCVEFITVVCKNCGLIRAQNYFRDQDVEDFYKNFYRTESYSENFLKNYHPLICLKTKK